MDNAIIAPLPRNLARLNSRLAGRDIAVPLDLRGAAEPAFILRPETAGLAFPAIWDFGPGIQAQQSDFILAVDGENWRIKVWGRAAEALLAPPDGLNPEDIPAELQPALLSLALEPLLDRASRTLGYSFRVGWSNGSGPESFVKEHFMLPFMLLDSIGSQAGAGLAYIPLSHGALSVLADLAKAFPRRPAADCSALPLSLSLCAGREAFPLRILREAEPGDVLRFSCPAEPPLFLEANGLALWTASLSDGEITIQGVLNSKPEEAAMSATPENAGASAAGSNAPGLSREDVDSLEIILTLELDERRISIGELAALGPGQVLATTASLDAPVTIKAGGKAVGKGRLVDLGDSLGVLIASLELGVQGGRSGDAA